MKTKLILILSFVLLLACTQSSNKSEDSSAQLHSSSPEIVDKAEIVNKYWKLTILAGQPVNMTKTQEREQYFTLKSDGTVTGFAGCNHFNGQYQLAEGQRLRFNENLAVTMKLCLDSSTNEAEFLNVFKITDNYSLNDDTLMLNVGRRAPLAVFEAVYF